jgi:hypothetical protein
LLDDTCARPTFIRYDYLWGWGTHRNVDQRQDKAHMQTHGKHAQASAGHERTEGPRKHTTHNRRHETKRRTNAQTGATNAHIGAKHVHTKADMWCKHPGEGTGRVAGPCHDCCVCARILSMGRDGVGFLMGFRPHRWEFSQMHVTFAAAQLAQLYIYICIYTPRARE